MTTPRELIRNNWLRLVDGISAVDVNKILDHLYQMRIISEALMDQIKRESDPEEKVRNLLKVVKKKAGSGAAFRVFVNALRETGNDHLADLISSPPPDTSSEVQPAQPESAPKSRSWKNIRLKIRKGFQTQSGTAERRQSSSSSYGSPRDWSDKQPKATAVSQLPGLRQEVTASLAELSVNPAPTASSSTSLLSARLFVALSASPSTPTARVPSLPSPSTPTARVPSPPSPLPQNVDYQAKLSSGPVSILGPQLGEVHLSGPRDVAYHAGTDRMYVMRSREIIVCDSRGNDPRVFYTAICGVAMYGVLGAVGVAVSVDGERVYALVDVYLTSTIHILNSSGELVREITSVPGGELGPCWAVTCYQQQVAVLAGIPPRVVILSRDGDEVREWSLGKEWSTTMAVDGDGYVYIADTEAVTVYSWLGLKLEKFRLDQQIPFTGGMCVDGDGRVCVSRYSDDRVDVYDRDCRLIVSLGGDRGLAPGQFWEPHGLCLLPDGRLVVSDTHNNRLQIF